MSCEPNSPVRGIFTFDIFDKSSFFPYFVKCVFKSPIYLSVLIPVRQNDVGISLGIGNDIVDMETGFVRASPDFSSPEHNYNEMVVIRYKTLGTVSRKEFYISETGLLKHGAGEIFLSIG